jgi:hypothetical protein
LIKRLPGVFTEIAKHRRLEPLQSVTFRDLKIDFNQLLGKGVFGYVYNVIQRPENEKGFFSKWFPYAYDYFFRTRGKAESKDCVKIAKPFLAILFNQITAGDPLPLAKPVQSLFASNQDVSTNMLLRQYGLSKIKFKHVDYSVYSQIKTKVEGYTFAELCNKRAFVNPKNYQMRKAFVDFLWALKNAPLHLEDIHQFNVMYDTKRKEWEIVDGNACQSEERSIKESREHLHGIVGDLLFCCPIDKRSKAIIERLKHSALQSKPCTKLDDANILAKASASVDDINTLSVIHVSNIPQRKITI